jgi:AmmeMemoRadiSam system protein B
MDLDFMPSPVPDRPGLLIRDPFHYSETTLIVPPVLVECLQCFDGQQTELDLRAALVRLTGELSVGDVERHLRETLAEAGFCEDETYRRLRDRQHELFAQAEWRAPAHAGSAYPDQADQLRSTLGSYLSGAPRSSQQRPNLVGIVAPHVSPAGGFGCYAAAYSALSADYKDRVFVILGTSHYGEPDRFGLTRKSFITPYGVAATAVELVDELASAGGPAVKMEDYSHAIEHSIEFQVVFLQHLYGPDIRILPILCGPFFRCAQNGGPPEDDASIRQFLAALHGLSAREGRKLFWVLGIDMAHMGRRYGDPFAAQADSGRMTDVAERDQERIGLAVSGDAARFWAAAQTRSDALKWCGTTPLYTFLKAVPDARGDLLRYEQWNIDEQSVVTFGAMTFER